MTVVADLRAEGNDLTEVEVKRAAHAFPESTTATLSAFANLPGGGTIVFGLDEAGGAFTATGVYDAVTCQQALASAARQAVEPPVTCTITSVQFEGHTVVVAEVDELPSQYKPCRVKRSGKAYLRAYDGDYELSALEQQAFVADRATPVFDRQPVDGARRTDLSLELVDSYLGACRSTSQALATMSDDDVLFRTGVLVGDDRVPSLAGVLMLGIYPQQYFPNCVIQASVAPGPADPPGVRAADAARFDGPIPAMLDGALRWVQRNTRTRVTFGEDGHGRDEPEYPTTAVRELVSNALVHRDLGPHALSEAVSLRLDGGQLTLANPGGLHGLTVDRLGKTGTSSARNGFLLRIGQNVRVGTGGYRVVEALASGIPTVFRELERAGMTRPRFIDQAIRFAVRVPNHTLLGKGDLDWLASFPEEVRLSDVQRNALVNMRHGTVYTSRSLRETFPMDSREAHLTLLDLVEQGVAVSSGERRARDYRIAPGLVTERTAAARPDPRSVDQAGADPRRRCLQENGLQDDAPGGPGLQTPRR